MALYSSNADPLEPAAFPPATQRPACPCLGTGLVRTKDGPDAIEFDFCSCSAGADMRAAIEDDMRASEEP